MINKVETRDNKLSFVDWLWEKYALRLQWTINGGRIKVIGGENMEVLICIMSGLFLVKGVYFDAK